MSNVIRDNTDSYFKKHEIRPCTDAQQVLQKHAHIDTIALHPFLIFLYRKEPILLFQLHSVINYKCFTAQAQDQSTKGVGKYVIYTVIC